MNGQIMAMDGRFYSAAQAAHQAQRPQVKLPGTGTLPSSAAEVSRNIADNLADTKESVQELQRLSDMVMGHKLQFNVNNDLNKVIVKVVDSATNEVIREIPSEDLQRIQARLKHAIGLLFDEQV
ncbi:MAG: flagellar protein FlaG [Treponema sp.]|nr:flagellar protein FlaG [Treponema sp.]